MKFIKWSIFSFLLPLVSCTSSDKKSMSEQPDATSTSATQLEVYELKNKNGITLKVTNFGAKIMSLYVPDRNGNFTDVVLGYDSAQQYPTGNPYFGAAIGRFGNRIAKGKFSLEGVEHRLAINNRDNALHGGLNGFHNIYWLANLDTAKSSIQFTYLSEDGEEGYPGNLFVTMSYTLSDENELIIDYSASTDKPTIVNLTHHSFFNLAGEGNGTILGHQLMINAKQFTPVDGGLIPTGELRNVKGSPFDFTSMHAIGQLINNDDDQLRKGNGYDHNWVLNKKENELTLAAKVTEPISGRVIEVFTTEPGLQFYSGNFLDGHDVGKGGKKYEFRSAFCLEAQHFPDSPNHTNFPSTELQPEETYHQKTLYKFSVESSGH
jgi:aldose 1-epimerase